jgi:hypothetical protein
MTIQKSWAIAVLLGTIGGMVCSSSNLEAGWQDLLGEAMKAAQTTLPATGSTATPAAGTGSALRSLSQADMAAGLKEALKVGAQRAIATLGKENGFLNDPQVKIPLPPALNTMDQMLKFPSTRMVSDRFVASMNHAAERAVPVTVDVFTQSIQKMTVPDAVNILQGPPDAATQYFRQTGGKQLVTSIRPLVEKATQESGVTGAYKALMALMPQGSGGLLSGVAGAFMGQGVSDIDGYVTEKAVDGLFVKIAEEEGKIRKDPTARSTELLKKVFGALSTTGQ